MAVYLIDAIKRRANSDRATWRMSYRAVPFRGYVDVFFLSVEQFLYSFTIEPKPMITSPSMTSVGVARLFH
jgi:hypothetical protein